jgi:uncharacterized surface protein with fasciclin (FAS1) repeats
MTDSNNSTSNDIVAVATENGSFGTLVAAVKAAGLVETLQGDGPFTVFAPTDDAFKALPAGLVDALLKDENKATLAKILTYHVVGSKVEAKDVAAGDVATVEGSMISVTVGDSVKLNDSATVTATDVQASQFWFQQMLTQQHLFPNRNIQRPMVKAIGLYSFNFPR